MDYGDVFTRAWQIGWRNKALWLLGILAGCSASGRGGGGQPTSGFRGYNFGSGDLPGGAPQSLRGFERFLENNAETLIWWGWRSSAWCWC